MARRKKQSNPISGAQPQEPAKQKKRSKENINSIEEKKSICKSDHVKSNHKIVSSKNLNSDTDSEKINIDNTISQSENAKLKWGNRTADLTIRSDVKMAEKNSDQSYDNQLSHDNELASSKVLKGTESNVLKSKKSQRKKKHKKKRVECDESLNDNNLEGKISPSAPVCDLNASTNVQLIDKNYDEASQSRNVISTANGVNSANDFHEIRSEMYAVKSKELQDTELEESTIDNTLSVCKNGKRKRVNKSADLSMKSDVGMAERNHDEAYDNQLLPDNELTLLKGSNDTESNVAKSKELLKKRKKKNRVESDETLNHNILEGNISPSMPVCHLNASTNLDFAGMNYDETSQSENQIFIANEISASKVACDFHYIDEATAVKSKELQKETHAEISGIDDTLSESKNSKRKQRIKSADLTMKSDIEMAEKNHDEAYDNQLSPDDEHNLSKVSDGTESNVVKSKELLKKKKKRKKKRVDSDNASFSDINLGGNVSPSMEVCDPNASTNLKLVHKNYDEASQFENQISAANEINASKGANDFHTIDLEVNAVKSKEAHKQKKRKKMKTDGGDFVDKGLEVKNNSKLSTNNILSPVDDNEIGASRNYGRRKLLILDLNGLLCDVVHGHPDTDRPHERVNRSAVFKRPFCDDFMKFCYENFDIGVWSSRRKENVDGVVDIIMKDTKDNLLFCWDASQCTYTGYKTVEDRRKPLVLKQLMKLWNKEADDLLWELGDYSPSNTLLIDDSPYKAMCNPPYTGVFPYPYSYCDENDNALGPGGNLRVYLEGLVLAEDVQSYVREHPFGKRAITSTNPSWRFYERIISRFSCHK